MQQILHCISLRVVRHSDTTSIVTAWSRQLGRVSIAVNAGSSREARRRRALMMPMSVFECVADVKTNQSMLRVKDVRPYLGADASGDPVRGVVGMFLADFLYAVLRESQPDALLTDFIFESTVQLRELSGAALANFHLYFIYRLGHFLGISPDIGTYAKGRCFDMREGIFTATAPLHNQYLDAQGAEVVYALSRLTPRSLYLLRLTRQQRNAVLDAMMQYYSMHHSVLSLGSALQVLRQVFD